MECYPQPNMNKPSPPPQQYIIISLHPDHTKKINKIKMLYHLSEDDSVLMQTKSPHLACSLSDTKPECKHG